MSSNPMVVADAAPERSGSAHAVDLSVCIIGRNEAGTLRRLADSLMLLSRPPLRTESIYVDSSSEDDSIAIAKRRFDTVIRLEDSEMLSASAARHIGTIAAKGRWILYLDGDMVLCEGFVPELTRFLELESGAIGLLGAYQNVYENGETRRIEFAARWSRERATHFGGAVLLRRDKVLEAGNWDPRLFAYEETDLMTRLRNLDGALFYCDEDFVNHYTRDRGMRETLAANLFPSEQGIGKKYYGFGQVLAARVAGKSLGALMRHFPEPFVLWAGVAASFGAALAAAPVWAACFLLGAGGFVAVRRGARFCILCLLLLPQAVLGYGKYEPAYQPRIVYRWPLNVILLGQAKSGTSIAAYRIYEGLPEPKHMHFEPTAFGHPKRGGRGFDFHEQITHSKRARLSKCLVFPGHDRFDWQEVKRTADLYHKKIWLCRDPRDLILSQFFYRLARGNWPKVIPETTAIERAEEFERQYQLVLRKEADPMNVSLLTDKYVHQLQTLDVFNKLVDQMEFDDSWYMLKYEDLVDGNLSALETYLGFKIGTDVEVSERFERVRRTADHDNWRRWFIPADIPVLKPLCTRYMIAFGYDVNDWELHAVTRLPSEHGSAYMKKVYSA